MGRILTLGRLGRIVGIRRMEADAYCSGRFEYEALRGGRNGYVFQRGREKNIWTTEGRNFILDVCFHGTAAEATWYIGLIQGATAPVAGDTGASFAFSEYISYDEAARQEWVEAAASSSSITTDGTNYAEFTFNETITITGAFLCTDATGAPTKLFAGSLFASGVTLNNLDILRMTWTGSLTSS